MRILITIPNLKELGGVANYYRALQGKFCNQVEYFQIGAWQGISSKPLFVQLIQAGKDIFALALKFRRYDLIHFNPSFCAKCFFREMVLLWIAKLFRRKVVIFIRGWDREFAHLVDRRFSSIFKWGYVRTDAFIVLSKEFKEKLISWGYRGPVYVETTVVDDAGIGSFTGNQDCRLGSAVELLYLARIERAKGVFQCVEALALLPPEKHVELTIAGNGNDLQELNELITEKKLTHTVNLTGWVEGPTKANAFRHADIFLFPSQYGEGMPNTVLEAMAYGLPVITTPVGGVKDFFEDGRMGFLLDPVSPENLAGLITRLLNDQELRKKTGRYNQKYAQDHFYATRVVQRLESIYHEVSQGDCRPEHHIA
jgi:glycosyltransferase involved in cell wall biosynthesis